MTNKIRTLLVLAVVCVQVVFFIGWYVHESMALQTPVKQIMVKPLPVDPRDLLSGQYMQLRYQFSNLNGRWDSEQKKTIYPEWVAPIVKNRSYHRTKSDIWVILQEQNGVYEPKTASFVRPENLVDNEVAIKGIKHGNQLTYGIERFYVPEGTKEPSRGDMEVELNIYKDGKVRLGQVYVKGKVWP